MFSKSNIKLVFTVITAIFLLSSSQADASILRVLPATASHIRGDEFFVDLKIDTEGDYINAGQVTVKFRTDVLDLIGIDKSGSVFNFWVEEPTLPVEGGEARFIAGMPRGITGGSLQMIRLKFKVTGSDNSEISLTNGAITANDGRGTNVLSMIYGANISVGVVSGETPQATAPVVPVSVTGATAAPVVVEEPQAVTREAVTSVNLPKKPELRVPTYADQSKWYSYLGESAVFWALTPDVTGVAVKVDNVPNTRPTAQESVLSTGKRFTVDRDGIWYVHVRFANNIGLGETNHYKISVDSVAPVPFGIKIDNAVSENPSPRIDFGTSDEFSGISRYAVSVDGAEVGVSTTTSMLLPAQKPGKHNLRIRAFDLAGNGVEDVTEFEISPLATPAISFVTENIAQGETIFASGKSIANSFIDIQVLDSQGRAAYKESLLVNGSGVWEITVNKPLASGKYTFVVQARDAREATSYPSDPMTIRVKPATILSLGFIDLSLGGIFFVVILLVISASSLAAWYYLSQKAKREAYGAIAGRDIDKFCDMLDENTEELKRIFESEKTIAASARETIGFRIGEILKVSERIRKFAGKELGKMK